MKVALVTAGGSGMGAAAARRLAGAGWGVGILSPSGRGEALAVELGGVGITGSNQSAADLQRLIDAALSRWGRIDALVASAGHGPRGGALALDDADWHRAMDVYFLSVVRPVRMVAPHLEAAGGGAIVAITSFVAQEPSSRFPTSAAMRAGLHAWIKIAADELGPRGIRINALLPGYIDSIPQGPEVTAAAPLRRQGTVEEVAGTVAFLLSGDAGYITGAYLRVDGGITRGM